MNICANFDILFYLSHPRNKYAEQTLFEINTMLYLAELLSIYDGCNAQKWGYGFARNKYGAPVSIELMEEVEFLCAKGYLSKDSSGYRDARANEGAKQLIDYLASSVQEEPDKHFVGYLTVFDGRRGKTSNQYERQEINYRSEYSSHPSMNYRRFYMAECV